MKKILTVVFLLMVVLFAAVPLQAASKPIQIALFNPVQIFPEKDSIGGIRLSFIYGKNANMTGLDWGLVTRTTGNLQGIQWGWVGIVDGDATGIQASLVNITKSSFTGLQYGWYNQANHVGGLQLGLVNNTTTMNGLQIGFLNFIHKGGWFPFFPIINGSFAK
jgi:hypothetical protein